MPPQDIQSTIKDPEFLKLSPDDQVAVLKQMRAAQAPATPVAKTPAVTELEKAARYDTGVIPSTLRGAELGFASGLGIPESSSPAEVVTGALGNVARGAYNVGAAAAKDIGQLASPQPLGESYLYRDVLGGMAQGLEAAGGESWKGLKDRDPEAFAHGFGSMAAQILTMRAGEQAAGKATGITDRARLARIATGAAIPGDEIANLERALPEIIKQAQQGGVQTVGDLYQTVKKAKQLADDRFNQGLAPIANQAVLPTQISQRIRNLITPDMAKTAEGRAQIKMLQKRAREYEKPWTYRELNAKRMTENENLHSYYKRDTQAQNASKLDTDISKAIRDGAADTVYQGWDKANPGGAAQKLKQQQGALWSLEDHLKGRIDDLKAKQLQFEGQGLADRVHARAAVHRGGISAYMTGSLLAPFEKGPEAAANAKIRKAFPQGNKTPFKKVAAASLPVSVLAGRATPFEGPPPPPSSEDEE